GTLHQRIERSGRTGPAPSDQGCDASRAVGGRCSHGLPVVVALAGEADQTGSLLECLHPHAGSGVGLGNPPSAPERPAGGAQRDALAPRSQGGSYAACSVIPSLIL